MSNLLPISREFDINPRVTLVGKRRFLQHSVLGVPTWQQSCCYQEHFMAPLPGSCKDYITRNIFINLGVSLQFSRQLLEHSPVPLPIRNSARFIFGAIFKLGGDLIL